MFIQLQEQFADQGLQFVGIAHDQLESTLRFGDEIGINYPSLVAITGGQEIMKQQGSKHGGSLPFTAIFDRDGKLVSNKIGMFTEKELLDQITPLL